MTLKLSLLSLATLAFTLSFGQIKFEDLRIDTAITGFHFAANLQGTMAFTKHGPSDIQTINPTAFSFTVAPNVTAVMAKSQLNWMLNTSKKSGYKISDFTEKDTTFQGYGGYYISYTETEDTHSYKNYVFNAFVIKDSVLVLFTGGDLDNGQYIDKFKQTFYNIKL